MSKTLIRTLSISKPALLQLHLETAAKAKAAQTYSKTDTSESRLLTNEREEVVSRLIERIKSI